MKLNVSQNVAKRVVQYREGKTSFKIVSLQLFFPSSLSLEWERCSVRDTSLMIIVTGKLRKRRCNMQQVTTSLNGGSATHQYIYIFVRRDLSMPQQVVQSCHAAVEAAKFYLGESLDHPSIIVCGVKTETALRNVQSFLHTSKIRFREFIEPDIGCQLTALATEPISDASTRKLFRKFQLLKGEC